MLDQSILLHLERLMPPNPPPITLETLWLAPLAEKRLTMALVNSYAARLDAWGSDMATIKRRLEFAATSPGSAVDLAPLSQMIEDVEAIAEYRAELVASARRAAGVEIAPDAALDAARRETIQTLIERDDAVVDQLLDLALVLRAFRAANSPDAIGGPTFSDPNALAQFLSDATAWR